MGMRMDLTWEVLGKDLQGLARRFDVVSENMANGNTPRYARKEVSFEDQLRDVIEGPRKLPMTATDPRHIKNIKTTVAEVTPLSNRVYDEVYRLDGNNVDPERENAVLAQSRMGYLSMNRLLAKRVGAYKLVIGGR